MLQLLLPLASIPMVCCATCELPPSPAAVNPQTDRRAGKPIAAPMLSPLSPGAVEPRGWLRDWAIAARNGITEGIQIERQPMPHQWHWQLEAPLMLRVPAKSFNWHPTELQALPETAIQDGESTSISLIPYGCTKFRISMFPVTARAWSGE
jgi:hypothetical protein